MNETNNTPDEPNYLLIGLGLTGLQIISEVSKNVSIPENPSRLEYIHIGFTDMETPVENVPVKTQFIRLTDWDNISPENQGNLDEFWSWLPKDFDPVSMSVNEKRENRVISRLAFFSSGVDLDEYLIWSIIKKTNVLIVGSIGCGLTSGILVDIAHVVKRYQQKSDRNSAVIGFFLLDSPDNSSKSIFTSCNSYPALRELNHYQNSEAEYNLKVKQKSIFSINHKGPAYNSVYFIKPGTRNSSGDSFEVDKLGQWIASLINNPQDCSELIKQDQSKSNWVKAISSFEFSDEDLNGLNNPTKNGPFSIASIRENLDQQNPFTANGDGEQEREWIITHASSVKSKDIKNLITQFPSSAESYRWNATKAKKTTLYQQTSGFSLTQLKDLGLRQTTYFKSKAQNRSAFRIDEDTFLRLDPPGGNPDENIDPTLIPASLGETKIGNVVLKFTTLSLADLQVDLLATDGIRLNQIKNSIKIKDRVSSFCDDFQNMSVYEFTQGIRKIIGRNSCMNLALDLSRLPIDRQRVANIIACEIRDYQKQLPKEHCLPNLRYVIVSWVNEAYVCKKLSVIQNKTNILDSKDLLKYPYPIANNYRNLRFAKEWSWEIVKAASTTFETCTKFLGIITFAEYFACETKHYVESFEKKNTSSLTVGDWLTLTGELLDKGMDIKSLCVRELKESIDNIRCTDQYLRIISEQKENGSVNNNNPTITKRNQAIHGQNVSSDLMKDFMGNLDDILVNLSWLESYYLVNINSRDADSNNYPCQLLSGWDCLFSRVELVCDEKLQPGVALINPQKKTILYLHPLIRIVDTKDLKYRYNFLWFNKFRGSQRKIDYENWSANKAYENNMGYDLTLSQCKEIKKMHVNKLEIWPIP
jgi:hypothetical protein